jgi:hypothetical protein
MNRRAQAVTVKARAILRDRGHSDGETAREYADWHIDIRSGASFISVWTSGGMVFLALSGVPVFYKPGPWEQYLDRLFHRLPVNAPASEPC